MVDENKIRELLQDFVNIQSATIIAEVGSVDEQNSMCTLIDGDVTYYNVRLQAVKASANGFCLIPKVGSMAIAVRIENTRSYMLLNAIEYDKVIMRGGENGGLINITDLVAKLNNIEKDINNLKKAFSNWAPVSQDGGSALKTAASTWFGSELTETKRDDIEDDTIIH